MSEFVKKMRDRAHNINRDHKSTADMLREAANMIEEQELEIEDLKRCSACVRGDHTLCSQGAKQPIFFHCRCACPPGEQPC